MNPRQHGLAELVASHGADYLIDTHHAFAPHGERLKLWARYRDSIIAGVWAFHRLDTEQRADARVEASNN